MCVVRSHIHGLALAVYTEQRKTGKKREGMGEAIGTKEEKREIYGVIYIYIYNSRLMRCNGNNSCIFVKYYVLCIFEYFSVYHIPLSHILSSYGPDLEDPERH